MHGGQQRVKEGVEMHARKTGQDHASYALIENIVRRGERFPAVNGYCVAALHKAFGKLVCKRLKPAVAGGNSASADDCDVHAKTFDL
jgi:hypothetical protein